MALSPVLVDGGATNTTKLISPPGPFQVVLVQPDGYPHVAAFSEVIEAVVWALRSLGAEVTFAVNRLAVPGPTPILFGANLLQAQEVDLLPPGTIIYNLEQVSESSPWCTPHYLSALRRCTVWDYSVRNVASLARMGVAGALHVPIGYVPQLTRIQPAAIEDIDVLFYGSMNERRSRVITQLRDLGLNAYAVFGVYGQTRDELISRSKIVVNIHYYETSIFELVRVSYLLANRKAVVAERSTGTEIDPDLMGAVQFSTYDQLAATCAELAHDDNARRVLSERGFRIMSDRHEANFLSSALETSTSQEKEFANK